MQEELILPEKQPLFEICTEHLNQSRIEEAAFEAIAASSCKYLIVICVHIHIDSIYVVKSNFLQLWTSNILNGNTIHLTKNSNCLVDIHLVCIIVTNLEINNI